MTTYTVADLPWEKDALVPHISKETIEFHYEKHHKGYVKKLNVALGALKKDEVKSEDIDDLIKEAHSANWTKIFNCGAQHWNHTFYWNCMAGAGTKPIVGKKIATAIDKEFGSLDKFREEFCAAAGGLFGSGWAWVVVEDKKLKIVKTSNANNPLIDGSTPILVCDVWEHAYYIDRRNNRGEYIKNFWELINWDFVDKNYINAMGN